ncbi:MAG: DNA-binding response regulator [Chloroflexi bacterium]|jgi:NarL family two-component system response regulator LiaR|nr:response regulator transcription factor [Dehalococcoidia bacterium]PKB80472.1 MAG: DNA-binding response regulator [SAR202 cluster bacterium MP-SInd-SRR3963457-G1]PKB84986.1 MAG: DNA-binding response regulator [SAR202 cluster bacterium MP-NPac-SRR3961935-G1]RUA31016.1 MAG: DNA-binding response regulator [Chloroflexota bacterium]|tara:strand:- start:1707 stop:2363 length:657 start_codon:yes stop_codon:yes gene_type:complete
MVTKSIKVLIADDHPLVREGLRALIATEPDMDLVGEASDGVEAVDLAMSLQPVIPLDLMMPNKTGIEAIQEIKEENPDARILVVTSFGEDENVFPAIKAGALGYLLKDSSPQELLSALREVHRGEPSLHPTIALKLIRELNHPSQAKAEGTPLTGREVEVLKLVAQGLSNHEIGETLVIAERTVSKHVSSIIEKLHVSNRTQVALYALKEGLATLDSA